MIDLKQWTDRNARRPLACAIATVLCLQIGYIAYLAHAGYSSQLRRIERVVETASLGIQQDNRSLIESTLLTGLRNVDAEAVALCRGTKADLLYPPSTQNPCGKRSGGVRHWLIRSQAVGVADYQFVFLVNKLDTYAPLLVLVAIAVVLWLALLAVLVHAGRRFQTEILGPLHQGLNEERALAIFELDELRRRNQAYNALSRKQAVSDALFELSAQVAHDIRSPLAALETASGDLSQIPEEKRILLRSAANRIRDIANSLLDGHRAAAAQTGLPGPMADLPNAEPAVASLLSVMIESAVTEKRLQLRSHPDIEIETAFDALSYGLFARVEPVEFKRVLSNLMNNAAEALEGRTGVVRVSLSARHGWVVVGVEDNGKGFPPELAARFGELGASHGKAGGSGLGLYHAKTCAASWGGRLELVSEVGKGSTLTLSLAQAPAPDWFVSELALRAGKAVIVLDDDPSIHSVWQSRINSLNARAVGIQLLLFSDARELKTWVQENPVSAEGALYLLDYELGEQKETGLSLAEDLDLGERAVLVTSRYEEQRILDACRALGGRMLPKGLAGRIPVRIQEAVTADLDLLDAVLIDDDPLVRRTWEIAAPKVGKRFKAFASTAEFLKAAKTVDRVTPIYVDSMLADGELGEDQSHRIYELGFREIYLATGYDKERFRELAHLRGVVGKAPPWSDS